MNHGRSSAGMEITAMILGIICLAGNVCFYVSIPLGGIAIILALLSRGDSMKLSTRAKLGFWLAIAGICTTVIFYAFSLWVVIQRYGSFEAFYAVVEKYQNLSLTELMQELYNQPIQ